MSNLDFEPGDTAILREATMKEGFRDLKTRTVTVLGGFGAKSFLSGQAVFVKFADGEEARIDRSDIDMEATEALRQENASVS